MFPRARGGRLVLVVCYECNHRKGSRSPLEWIEYLLERGDLESAQMSLWAYHQMGRVLPPGLLLRDVMSRVAATVLEPVDAS